MNNNTDYRLRNVKKITLELYCRIFGYESIVVTDETDLLLCKSLKRIKEDTGRWLITPEQIVKGKKYLLVADDLYTVKQNDLDAISFQQFTIDLETVAEIPEYLLKHVGRDDFIERIRGYLAGFEKRGWLVALNIRESLRKELPSYICLEQVKNTDANIGILVICDRDSRNYREFYEKQKHEKRVERYWLTYFLREWINELLLRYYDKLFKKNGIFFVMTNCAWGFDHFLGRDVVPTSEKIEGRSRFSFSSISESVDKNKGFLSQILFCSEDEALDQCEELLRIPQTIEVVPGMVKHINTSGNYLNVSDGRRRTAGLPEDFENTIWLFGGCVFFGYVVPDDGTIASQMQYCLNIREGKKWRVVNLGTWGGNFDNTHLRLKTLPMKKGDIVIVSHAMGNILTVEGVNNWDISKALDDVRISDCMYWDRVVHCGEFGYRLMAGYLLERIQCYLEKEQPKTSPFFLTTDESSDNVVFNELSGKFDSYIQEIKDNVFLKPFKDVKKTGAIVMNCNPFTNGHLYLIETASLEVELLYIFVVEEDKSFFPFEERIELVKRGTSHLKNVCVCRSGTLMISSLTFPGYFVKDNPEQTDIDSTSDVEIFSRIIAPTLGISVRFVGEEPIDYVTREYNEKMKEILPLFGVEVIEIPRKSLDTEKDVPISASLVRRYLQVHDFEKIKEMVPFTTYHYLLEHYQRVGEEKNEVFMR